MPPFAAQALAALIPGARLEPWRRLPTPLFPIRRISSPGSPPSAMNQPLKSVSVGFEGAAHSYDGAARCSASSAAAGFKGLPAMMTRASSRRHAAPATSR